MKVRQVTRVHEYLERAAGIVPDKLALVCDDRRLTWREVDRQATALAGALRRRGVERADRVVACLDNSVEAAIAVFGVLRADAVFSVINPQTKTDKLRYILRDSGAKCLIIDAAIWNACGAALWPVPELAAVLVVGAADDAPIGYGAPRQVRVDGYAAALSEPDTLLSDASISIDLASIIYTSGSTGDPKGVMLTHQNMVAAAESITTYLENQPSDVILNALPLSFDYGLYQWLMVTQFAGTLILERSFSYPMAVLGRIDKEQITGVPIVPTMVSILSGYARRQCYNSVRYVTNTAAALPAAHIDTLRSVFPNARIFSMYGLTECKRVSYLPPEDLPRKPQSVGRAMPNMEVFVVTAEGRRADRDATGELVVRGAQVMRGYWRKPEQTAAWLKPGDIPGELYLWTGDQFRIDDEGYLYFLGRADDIIKSRGEKVSPREVENAIYALDGVKEVAIVGVPDEVLGQAIHAFVVLHEANRYTVAEIVQHCAGRLENFMVPKCVVFVDALPKTASGKIAPRGLVAQTGETAPAPDDSMPRR